MRLAGTDRCVKPVLLPAPSRRAGTIVDAGGGKNARPYLDGQLDLDAMVSQTITLDDIQDAFAAMERGTVIRSVISFEQ